MWHNFVLVVVVAAAIRYTFRGKNAKPLWKVITQFDSIQLVRIYNFIFLCEFCLLPTNFVWRSGVCGVLVTWNDNNYERNVSRCRMRNYLLQIIGCHKINACKSGCHHHHHHHHRHQPIPNRDMFVCFVLVVRNPFGSTKSRMLVTPHHNTIYKTNVNKLNSMTANINVNRDIYYTSTSATTTKSLPLCRCDWMPQIDHLSIFYYRETIALWLIPFHTFPLIIVHGLYCYLYYCWSMAVLYSIGYISIAVSLCAVSFVKTVILGTSNSHTSVFLRQNFCASNDKHHKMIHSLIEYAKT